MSGLDVWLSAGAVSIWSALSGSIGDVFEKQGVEGVVEGGQ
jgi:hypothetical protein